MIMTDREKKIAEIREALEKATPGPWYAYGSEVFIETAPICQLWGLREEEYRFENYSNNANLIANAPEWLQFLLSELERSESHLQQELESNGMTMALMEADMLDLNSMLEQVKQERDLLKLNLDTQTKHFNDTTEELAQAYEEMESMECELAAKDKAIKEAAEWPIPDPTDEVLEMKWHLQQVIAQYTEKGEQTDDDKAN